MDLSRLATEHIRLAHYPLLSFSHRMFFAKVKTKRGNNVCPMIVSAVLSLFALVEVYETSVEGLKRMVLSMALQNLFASNPVDRGIFAGYFFYDAYNVLLRVCNDIYR